MTHDKANSNGKRGSQRKRPPASRDKSIRVEPTRRERVDPDMIALCYWLIAQHIVQEADSAPGDPGQPDAATDGNNDRAADRPGRRAS